jgi:hypothetical protein
VSVEIQNLQVAKQQSSEEKGRTKSKTFLSQRREGAKNAKEKRNFLVFS